MGLGIDIQVNGGSQPGLAEAAKVEVYESMGETTWFSIQYPEDIRDGDMIYTSDGRLDPGSKLTILAGLDDRLECLVSGPVTSQKIHFEHGGQSSWVEVQGADNSVTMDREIKSEVWANVTDGEAVMQIVANYGMIPDIATTNARHLETKHSLIQRETDLRFVKRMARRNGCYFWITCDEHGIETAHFQRPQLENTTEYELTINHEFPSIQSLDITWDVERPTSVEGAQLDLNTKNDINGPAAQSPQTALGTKNLSAITGDTRTMHVSSPSDDSGNMQARHEGALIEADWFIKATCRTSLNKVGYLIRTHSLVFIRGAGSRHSGQYYVAGVRHIIDATDHVMELELIRNAWNE